MKGIMAKKGDKQKYFHSLMHLETSGDEKDYHEKKKLEYYERVKDDENLDKDNEKYLRDHVNKDSSKNWNENVADYVSGHSGQDEEPGNSVPAIGTLTPVNGLTNSFFNQ